MPKFVLKRTHRKSFGRKSFKARVGALTRSTGGARTWRKGLNVGSGPRMYGDTRQKLFYPLPNRMGLKASFYSDPRWDIKAYTSPGSYSNNAGQVYQSFMYLTMLDMSRLTGGTPNSRWHSVYHDAMCRMYQSFQYQTTFFSGKLQMDYFWTDSGRNPIESISVAVAVVPMSYVRNRAGAALNGTNAGTFFSGVDYYSTITSLPHSKTGMLTRDGNSGFMNFNFKVDAFQHSGSPIEGKSNIENNGITDTTVTITYPNDTGVDQQVILFAFRWVNATTPDSVFKIRASLCCEQHFIYTDPIPPVNYIRYDVATGEPDNQ